MIFSFLLPLLTETLRERLLGEGGWEGEVHRTHVALTGAIASK
ncbi:MAG TPA: hypothetical protein V6D25_06625 [Leptolyngbyaceae cyanobacterium]